MTQKIYIDSKWNLVDDPANAVMVKVIDDDGRVRFGIRPGVTINSFPDHEGRPGKVGGSLPRDASAAGEVGKVASEKIKRVRDSEPRVTKMLVSLSGKYGAEMKGLDNRLKKEESLARKIQADMAEKNIDAQTAADQINDALRYTMVYQDHTAFTDTVLSVEKEMKSQGFKRYDTKYKNTFGPEKVYEGYNTVWINNQTGDLFELQFHTADSLRIKTQNHKLYEKFRVSTDPAERAEYIQQMIDNWKDPSYKRPLNYQALGTD